LGFPPPSHHHINQQVPWRNEELPKSQSGLSDFKEVLRKKHANGAAWLCDRTETNALWAAKFAMQYQMLMNGVRRRRAAVENISTPSQQSFVAQTAANVDQRPNTGITDSRPCPR
jgi:hypothetical protein